MPYAEVSVNSPAAGRRAFTYSIPNGLDINIGHAVWVPFGSKVLQGVVLALCEETTLSQTRDIISLIDPLPVLSKERAKLALWISQHYLSPLFNAVSLMLPPGFSRRMLTFLSTANNANPDISSLNEEQQKALRLIQKKDRVEQKSLEKELGQKKAVAAISSLLKAGFITRSYELEPIKIKPRTERRLSLAISADAALKEAALLQKKGATLQASLLRYLALNPKQVSLAEAAKNTGATSATAKTLAAKGFFILENVEVRRETISYENIVKQDALKPTAAQKKAITAIEKSFNSGGGVFLLHGVTGSGKTEVYLQATATAIKQGKRAIVLVPEIALTPQTIERFAARFPHRVAVLHSQLSLGEQYDEWRRIGQGEFDVVIGPRSAIFAPQPDLGLIVIDEEHEWTYKQTEKSPRYHARDAALKLAELLKVTVVMGSATPDVASYYRATNGDYELLTLPDRLAPRQDATLPEIELIDLRKELKAGNRSIFSHSLRQGIEKSLESKEQVILFFNRRGGATFVQCRDCGHVLRCRRCDVPLSYHPDEEGLVCHQCSYRATVPTTCPKCASPRIKYLGLGTQQLAREAGYAFPLSRIIRWDSDATRHKDAHRQILEDFRNHKADILVGTQMVAKGLDLPKVTLVGVISADTALNLPDFRAGERTFQLLAQVSGRAGRGKLGGKAIIQSYSPEHYAIQAAVKHDYAAFYEQEIEFRRQLGQPPFNRLVRLLFSHTNDSFCQKEAEKMKRLLQSQIDELGIFGLDIIGPAPAFTHRLRGRFRWQLLLRGRQPATLLQDLALSKGWLVDVDPVGTV